MLARGSYPFNNDNVGPAFKGQPAYPDLITPSYFNSSGIIPISGGGSPTRSGSGYGTNWPAALSADGAYDLCVNTKGMYYNIAAEVELVTDDTIFGYSDMESIGSNGIIKRLFVSSGSIFQHKFQSINSGNVNNRVTTDCVLIDFTQGFCDLRKPPVGTRNYYWFPKVLFSIAGAHGTITNGYDNNNLLMWNTPYYFAVPVQVNGNNPGIQIGNAIFISSEVGITEKFADIWFTPQHGPPGTEVTITCPAAVPKYDDSGHRDGFTDVVQVTFKGAPPITNFTKLKSKSGTSAVIDQIKVVVPAGAKTDVISFKSVVNQSQAAKTTDYYATFTNFRVD